MEDFLYNPVVDGFSLSLDSPLQIPKETLDAFNGDELRARVFYEKYAMRGPDGSPMEKTPDEMWHRVAREIASVEKTPELRKEWEDKFYWLLEDWKFVPGGRILFGAGQKRKATTLNCYVLPSPSDSLESIFDTAKAMARTYSLGGGVGIDLSGLRPKNSPVNNSAIVSTGAASFMELFSTTTGTIGQSGRRGALMLTMDVGHPDIEDFITAKKDRSKVNYANISVKVTDEFMKAVENGEDFILHFKNDKADMTKTVNAKDLWNKIVQTAWASAEPGVLFWDAMIRNSTSNYNGMTPISTNPCLSHDSLVLTKNGLKKIGTIIEPVMMHDGGGGFVNTKVWRTGFKDTVTLVTQSGYEVKCTPDHPILTKDGWIFARETLGKFLPFEVTEVDYEPIISDEYQTLNYELLGFIMGDGGWHLGSNRMKYVYFTPERDDEIRRMAETYFATESYYSGKKLTLNIPYEAREAYIFKGPIAERLIPDWMFSAPKNKIAEFLRGLYSANGSVISDLRIQLVSINKSMLKQVQALFGLFGIKAKLWYHDKEQLIEWQNGTYVSRKSWHLVISRESVRKFALAVGFLQSYKQAKLLKAAGKPLKEELEYERVVEVQPSGFDDVFDFGMEITHSTIVNGITVHNCAEIPLPAGDCCCLGSLNLSYFVMAPFQKGAVLDIGNLTTAALYATRFLDDVLDYNADKHPLPIQKEASLRGRRIGVGITGLGDMLIKHGIKYDSAGALEFVDTVMKFLRDTIHDASIDLAEEKGVFPAYDPVKHANQPFIKTLPSRVRERMAKSGIRNVALQTVPPVGSGSILAGCSSGIEPVFALSYKRRSKSLSQKEFDVSQPILQEYFTGGGSKPLPDYFTSAHQIKPEFRVKMQAAVQKYIDQSISSTVNLPHDISLAAVNDIYFQAWKSGLKGITVYREGSREGILETTDAATTNKPKLDEHGEFERPRTISGRTTKMKMSKDSLYVTLNNNGKPTEVFVELGKSGTEIKADAEAIGRLISLYLQSGGSIENAIKSLRGIQSGQVSWDSGIKLLSIPDAVAKALELLSNKDNKTLVESGDHGQETPTSDKAKLNASVNGEAKLEICPECHEEALIEESGCATCRNCGYSQC